MFFFNQKDYDNWCNIFGLLCFTTIVLLLFSCSQEINNSVTTRIEDKKPVEIKQEIVSKSMDKIPDRIIEDEPMRITFYDDRKEQPSVEPSYKIYIVGTWKETKDCLWNIADKMYENPLAWVIIYEANRDIIQDPDVIYPGQELIIPWL